MHIAINNSGDDESKKNLIAFANVINKCRLEHCCKVSAFSFRFACDCCCVSHWRFECMFLFSQKWMQQFANRSLAWRRHFFHRSFASVFKCQRFKRGCVQSTEVSICHLYWIQKVNCFFPIFIWQPITLDTSIITGVRTFSAGWLNKLILFFLSKVL